VIATVAYRPGRFFNASLDKASEHNERHGLRVVTTDGRDMACVQIAGLIARRTVCDVTPGENVLSGQRMGIIRFGSRVDIYLPPGVAPLVGVGQRSVAGETVLADLRSQEPARDGEIR
jgi:phosphatidylserine decarboxylase